MPAYLLFDIQVNDPVVYEEYQAATRQPGVGSHDVARALVRGGKVESLEGGWEPGRLLVLEFPDAEAARAWYFSPAYQAARQIRDRAATTRAVLVEGVPGQPQSGTSTTT
jgi:uncharacterized protein (DUF1330 family)